MSERCSGYDEGYNDGRRALRDGLLADLLEKVERRQRGASLPTPIYSDTMTLEEVEQMIREAERS